MSTVSAGIYEEIQRLKAAGDPDATKRLVQIMQEDAMAAVRAVAAKAISEIHGMDSARPLIKLLQSPNPQARVMAAEALGEMDAASAVDALISSLQDEEDPVRASAAAALGKMGATRAIPNLVQSLNDASLEAQFAAAGSLADMAKEKAIDPLLAWSDRVLAAPIKEFTAHQKATMIHAIWVNLLEQLEDDQLYLLTSHIGQSVDIKTWGILNTGARETHCWLQETVESPIGRAVKEELALRKAETSGGIKGARVGADAPPVNGTPTARQFEQPATVILTPEEAARMREEALAMGASLSMGEPTDAVSPEALAPTVDEILGKGVEPSPQEAEGTTETPTQEELPEAEASEVPAFDGSATDVPTDRMPAHVAEALAAAGNDDDLPPEEETKEFPLPAVSGALSDFLALLAKHQIGSLVVIGGAVRDLALGRPSEDIDVALLDEITPEMRQNDDDPVAWNSQFAALAGRQIARLADALEVSLEDLLDGKATFAGGDGTLPVHYVGPYLLEQTETSFDRRQVGRVLRQRVSRLGIVVDKASGRPHGLAPISTIDSLCIDCYARPIGNLNRYLANLHDRVYHVDKPPKRLAIGDIFRALTLKHGLRAELTESASNLLFSAAEAVSADPDAARAEFAGAEFDRLAAAAGMDRVAEEFELLGLVDLLAGWLEEGPSAEIKRIAAANAKTIEERLAGVRSEAQAAEADLESKAKEFDSKNAQFAEFAGSLDAAQRTAGELADRRREGLAKLAEAERAAEEAAKALEGATARMRESTASGKADVAVIRGHRESLGAHRTLEAEATKIKDEVKAIESEIEANRATTLELQAGLERIGEELESAVLARDEAQAKRDEAQAALDRLRAEVELTPEGRRAKLRERPAPAEAAA